MEPANGRCMMVLLSQQHKLQIDTRGVGPKGQPINHRISNKLASRIVHPTSFLSSTSVARNADISLSLSLSL
jgi:hypothetical protein